MATTTPITSLNLEAKSDKAATPKHEPQPTLRPEAKPFIPFTNATSSATLAQPGLTHDDETEFDSERVQEAHEEDWSSEDAELSMPTQVYNPSPPLDAENPTLEQLQQHFLWMQATWLQICVDMNRRLYEHGVRLNVYSGDPARDIGYPSGGNEDMGQDTTPSPPIGPRNWHYKQARGYQDPSGSRVWGGFVGKWSGRSW